MATETDISAELTARQEGMLPGQLELVWKEVSNGRAHGSFVVAKQHLAPNGYLHAASIIALADSACGYGCMASLPDGATNFTTIELKANYLGSAKLGETVTCAATLKHGGRSTQVWDAEVVNAASGKTIALFRCTQMILYPR